MSAILSFLDTQAKLWVEIHQKIATSTVTKSGARGNFTAKISENSSLLKDIRTETTEKDDVQYVRIWAPERYLYANYGRGPGKMPPIDPIKQWVAKKGLADTEGEVRSIAFAIAKTIAKRGTAQPPYHWLEKTAGLFEPEFAENVRANASALFLERVRKLILGAAKQ